ncbi:hypothetical protein [Salinibaculum rarum]|uniref:hypothetical protein n=1 Tax=Salinibaculum rarum TaxID=3058903 RepID=UPI00265F0F7E|nr:hypothetical protein [Salinibaculum sp. KK48]
MSIKRLAKTSLKNQYYLTQNDGMCKLCSGGIRTVVITFQLELSDNHDFDFVTRGERVYICGQPECENHLTDKEQRQVAEAKHEDRISEILDSEDRPPFDT